MHPSLLMPTYVLLDVQAAPVGENVFSESWRAGMHGMMTVDKHVNVPFPAVLSAHYIYIKLSSSLKSTEIEESLHTQTAVSRSECF